MLVMVELAVVVVGGGGGGGREEVNGSRSNERMWGTISFHKE